METKHEILRMALAISWAWRASGKESHAGFHACMEHFRGYAPEDVVEKVGRASLHYKEPIVRWANDAFQELKATAPEIASLVGGTSPHIEKLRALLEEVA